MLQCDVTLKELNEYAWNSQINRGEFEPVLGQRMMTLN